MILKPYKYLYYRIYAWNLRVWGESDLPQFNALFGVSFLVFVNMMTLLTAIEVTTGKRFSISRATTIGTAFAMIVIGYFLLVHNSKYLTIAKEFSGETSAQKKLRFAACVIYVILTFVGSIWLVELRNS